MLPDRFRLPLTIAAFALAQSLCWGMTFNLPAITGQAMADALGLPYPAVMAGATVMLVTMAAGAIPFLKLFERFGARPVMPVSTVIGAGGLAVIAFAASPVGYFLGWLLVGIGGTGMLTTAIQIGLAEVAGAKARPAIAALLVFGGLSTTICWPLLGALQSVFGWRMATLIGGVASGAMAVARSTMPLDLFPAGAYARASSMLALPLNLSFACAPPLFAAIIAGPGSDAALWVATALSLSALASLGLLVHRHRRRATITT